MRCAWSIYSVNCNKIGAANAIRSLKRTKEQKQTTNKASCKIFTGFEVGKNVCVVFPKPKNKTKG